MNGPCPGLGGWAVLVSEDPGQGVSMQGIRRAGTPDPACRLYFNERYVGMSRFRSVVLPLCILLFVTLLSGCDSLGEQDDQGDEDRDREVQTQVREILGSDVTDLQVREINVAEVMDGLESGEAIIPIATPDNEIRELTLSSRAANLRAEEVEEGILRSGDESVDRVPLPPEQNYYVGECVQPEVVRTCGGLTVLDDDRTMLRGLVRHSDFGVSYIQSVNHLLGSDDYPDMHVIYNMENTAPLEFSEEESPAPEGETNSTQSMNRKLDVEESTSVVLDGDVEFYNINQNTVWRRQESLMLAVQLTTMLIEPSSSDTWELDLSIAGQEVWVSGGPSTNDGDDLINRLQDPSYYLIHSLSEEQMHLFLLGYDIDGTLLGKAGGIGNDDGWGEWSADPQSHTDNHLFSEARSVQSMHTKMATLTHEVGHLIGGRHGNSISSGCSGSSCGRSIMNGTMTGSQEFFFSDDNDSRISDVIDATLP